MAAFVYALVLLAQLLVELVHANFQTVALRVNVHEIPRLDKPSFSDPLGNSDPYIQVWEIPPLGGAKIFLYKSNWQLNKRHAEFVTPPLQVPVGSNIQIDVHDKDLVLDDPIGFLLITMYQLTTQPMVGGPMTCGRLKNPCGSMYVNLITQPSYYAPPLAVPGYPPAGYAPPQVQGYPPAGYAPPPVQGYPPAGYPPPSAVQGYPSAAGYGYSAASAPYQQQPPPGYPSSGNGYQQQQGVGALANWLYQKVTGNAPPMGGHSGVPRDPNGGGAASRGY